MPAAAYRTEFVVDCMPIRGVMTPPNPSEFFLFFYFLNKRKSRIAPADG
jgi:hypothetical protein